MTSNSSSLAFRNGGYVCPRTFSSSYQPYIFANDTFASVYNEFESIEFYDSLRNEEQKLTLDFSTQGLKKIAVNSKGEVYMTGLIGTSAWSGFWFGGINVQNNWGMKYFVAKASYQPIFPLTTLDLIGEPLTSYPNPTNDFFYIDFSSTKHTSFEVYNSAGQIVLSKEFEKLEVIKLEVSEFNSGLYFYRLRNSNKTFSGSFIKK
jgi:hypothetical protein